MAKYIAKRLLLGMITLCAIAFVMFIFQQIIPDKPYDSLIRGTRGDPERIAAIRAHFHADDPFYLQYLRFLEGLTRPLWSWHLSGGFLPTPDPPDLGDSIVLHETVWSALTARIGNTVILMTTAYVITLLVAVPIGIISAVRQYSKLDNAVTSLAFIGISLPNFWFGTLLIYAFAIFPFQHGFGEILPSAGIHNVSGDAGVADLARHLVLPVIVLAVQSIAQYSRFIRAAMLEALAQDYVRTARAKGLANNRVVLRHAFRNSLLPFITLLGLDVPQLFVGAVVTETVFNWPGMGLLFTASASVPDFPTLIGIAVILSVLVVFGNLVADIAYTAADPRINYA